MADSIEAVVSLAEMGIVEIHAWNSTADDIDRPNRIVWDLDLREFYFTRVTLDTIVRKGLLTTDSRCVVVEQAGLGDRSAHA